MEHCHCLGGDLGIGLIIGGHIYRRGNLLEKTPRDLSSCLPQRKGKKRRETTVQEFY